MLKLELMVAEAGALEHIVFLFTVPHGIGTPLKHLMHRDALSEQELGVLAEALAALADPALLTQALERERLWQAQGLSGWPERSLADSVKLAGWWVGGRSWLWT
ncbi:MAG: hypothetical protein HYZ00_05850, partial [Candidatus Hydrogenedentes bacterium]|nr:hypothetical protein [Candidatus Hydrogenedentota bacterium]